MSRIDPLGVPRSAMNVGAAAEQATADYLVASGYTILHRNKRFGHLELDIVARLGGVVAVVEVRARGPGAYERPFESIAPAKRERIRKATDMLWRGLKADESIERIRLDAAAVTFNESGAHVEYIEGAI